MNVRAQLASTIEDLGPDMLDLSRRVHASPELAFAEHKASTWTAELLERNGFEVTRGLGGPTTAFLASWRGSGDGPVVAFLGEYDALPEIGHGCGHNVMCSRSAAAASAVGRLLARDCGGPVRS